MKYHQIETLAEMSSEKQSVVRVKATAEGAVALYRKGIIESIFSDFSRLII